MIQLPYWLLKLLPMWDYICPKCKREVEQESRKCPYCGENYGMPLRVPPKVLKDKKALEEYVHKYVFPKVSTRQREYLAQYFTVIFEDGFESGDFSNWTGTYKSSGASITVVDQNPHHGTYRANAYVPTGTSTRRAYCYKSVNVDLVYIREYVQFKDALPTDSTSSGVEVLYGRGTAGLFQVGLLGTNCRWGGNYRKGTTWTSWQNLSVFGSLDQWYCVEISWYKHATEGWFKVWLDGNLIFQDVNIDTSNKGNLAQIRCGIYRSYMPTSGAAHNVWLDCVVVADTYIGPEVEEAYASRKQVFTVPVAASTVQRKTSFSIPFYLEKEELNILKVYSETTKLCKSVFSVGKVLSFIQRKSSAIIRQLSYTYRKSVIAVRSLSAVGRKSSFVSQQLAYLLRKSISTIRRLQHVTRKTTFSVKQLQYVQRKSFTAVRLTKHVFRKSVLAARQLKTEIRKSCFFIQQLAYISRKAVVAVRQLVTTARKSGLIIRQLTISLRKSLFTVRAKQSLIRKSLVTIQQIRTIDRKSSLAVRLVIPEQCVARKSSHVVRHTLHVTRKSLLVLRQTNTIARKSSHVVRQFAFISRKSIHDIRQLAYANRKSILIIKQTSYKVRKSLFTSRKTFAVIRKSLVSVRKTAFTNRKSLFSVRQVHVAQRKSFVRLYRTWQTRKSVFSITGFYLISITAEPTSIIRRGVAVSSLRCDWHDDEDLPTSSYTCEFYVRAPSDADYSFVGNGTVVKEETKEYHATFDWDPADNAETGLYDIKAKVRR